MLALGNIDYGTENAQPPQRMNRVETDLDRKLAAVLAQAEEVAPSPHLPGLRRRLISLTVLRVITAKTFRHQQVNGLADHLLAAIAEHGFHLGVDQPDGAL